jgi:hypothetical protein
MLNSQGLDRGKRFKIPVLDIFSLHVKDTIVEVLDLIPVKVGINVMTVYLLKIGDTFSWVDFNGYTLKEKHASGFLYRADIKGFAESKDFHYIFDFLSIPVLKSDKSLSNPEDLFNLKIRLSGVDLSEYPLLNEGRQVLKGDFLEISKENIEELKDRTYKLPYKNKDLEPFLKPTPFVQSDHHTVIYNARKFVDIEKNSFRLARYLTSNLYLTITKAPLSRLYTAMDIFKTRSGESNEHTVLFTSFARAGGLPTRMVGGLVYRKGYFYYHAWPEIWLDKWVPVDPTLSQFPADVTHVRLMEGDIDKLASLGGIIKDIRIDIIGAK